MGPLPPRRMNPCAKDTVTANPLRGRDKVGLTAPPPPKVASGVGSCVGGSWYSQNVRPKRPALTGYARSAALAVAIMAGAALWAAPAQSQSVDATWLLDPTVVGPVAGTRSFH